MQSLSRKIRDGSAVICIVGLGHVGLSLALPVASRYRVYGLDTDAVVVQGLLRGDSHIDDVPDADLRAQLGRTFFPTTDPNVLELADIVIIAVPTPVNAARKPDMRYINGAIQSVAQRLKPSRLVVLESTTYPGTVDEVVVPTLERASGLKAGVDFAVAHSPERIDPGNRSFKLSKIPKLVGGIDEESTAIATLFYSQVFDDVISLRDAKTAEATKMLENVFRQVNIALVNEMAIIFERMGVNIWEAIKAARTKPFGYMPFYPGPGVGGHCVPVDPLYLDYRARQRGSLSRFIELAASANEFMKFHTVSLLEKGLGMAGKTLVGSDVAILGLSYKGGVRDTRESPSRGVIEECFSRGCDVRTWDSLVRTIETDFGKMVTKVPLEEAVRGADAVIIMVDHQHAGIEDIPDLLHLMRPPPVIVDTRNFFDIPPDGAIYLGLGKPIDGQVLTRRRREWEDEVVRAEQKE